MNKPKSIGFIEPDRLKYIPDRHWAKHEFCFHLHDLMARLLVQMEAKKVGHVKIKSISDDDRKLLENGMHILDFLNKTGRTELERRVVINHLCNALYSDALHFIYEGLRALEKRKFSVAFALFRKPFKESILIAAQMCADEETFFNKMKTDAKNLLNRRALDEKNTKELLDRAIKSCRGTSFISSSTIYDLCFNRGNNHGFAGVFDKANHLVTEYSQIKTENYNINLIFKNPNDNDVYDGDTYANLAKLLLFFNLMQIELYSRMTDPSKKYQDWMIFTAIGAYEALFSTGRSRMLNFVNRNFKDFLICPACSKPLVVKKPDAARLFIGETIDCNACFTNHHFPFGWLLSKVNLNILDDKH